jgi:HmuY protein
MTITPGSWRRRIVPLTAVAVFVAIAITLVALTLRPPNIPTYSPTPAMPGDAGHSIVGPVVYTVDATSPEQWRYFSFHLGSVVDNAGAKDWDLAFRRYQIIAGGGGILDLGEVSFADVKTVPETGYQANDRGPDPRNPAIASWYRYGFFSHVLSPKPHVWAVRTADGRYAKIEILSYYCPGSRPGCLTFRYVYQGNGSRDVTAQ